MKLEGVYELTSLMGNVSFKEGKPFLHLHVNLSNHSGETYGGHLFNATINATGEFFIDLFDQKVTRNYDDDIGLHLLNFCKDV